MRKLAGVELLDATERSPDELAGRAAMIAATMRFEKWQALGNDYLIVEADELPWELTPARVRKLCDPHLGVGSDGVLLLSPERGPALRRVAADLQPRRLRGRALGQRLARGGHVPAPPRPRRRRRVRDPHRRRPDPPARSPVRPARRSTMGAASTASADYPSGAPDGRGELEAGGRRWRFQHVSIGNPQCAIACEELETLDLPAIGPQIEHHALFPNRTNVSWYRELEPGVIRARIFERGVGETLSSGTGASGAAVAHHLAGGPRRDHSCASTAAS